MRKLNLFFKRIFDLSLSLILLVIFSPIIILIILAIKLDSSGPAIFKQLRLGKNGEEFTAYKFRTMYDKSSIGNLAAPGAGDPRVTRVGKLLRKTSLDELPQLFNVLNNTMSIIGPRAVPKKEIDLRLDKMILEHPENEQLYRSYMRVRQEAKPGITGMAQAYGRSSLTTVEATKLDVYYVEHYTLLLDLKIFVRSIVTVLFQIGVN